MKYYFEMLKGKVFSVGYIDAISDNEALEKVKSDMNNGNVVFLQKCESSKTIIDSWPRDSA